MHLIMWCCALATLRVEGIVMTPQLPQTITSRSNLVRAASWQEQSINLVTPGLREGDTTTKSVAAKVVYYRSPIGGVVLSLFSDPRTKYTYVVLGGQSFYISGETDAVACTIAGGSVTVTGSIFRAQDVSGASDEVLNQFVATTSDAAMMAAKDSVSINVSSGVPIPFWSAHGGRDSQIGLPTIVSIDVFDGLLRADVLGGGATYKGTFWVDLNAQKPVRTVVDGKQVFPAK
jgi:hypothetical protein